MPELPEVETVKRGLEPVLTGRKILKVETRRANLRWAFPDGFAAALEGAKVVSLSRRAKYILVALDHGTSLLIHLGMTGRFTVLAPEGANNLGQFYFETGAGEKADGPHDHVVLHLEDGLRLVYSDPRRFGMMDLVPADGKHKLLDELGVEPLGNGLSADYLTTRFKGKAAPMKAALLDQGIIAGLGNIYVCEALWRAQISPTRKAGTVKRDKLEELVRHIRDILNEAILAGGSTLQDFQGTNGEKGEYQQRFKVYDREGEDCLRGDGVIKRIVQSGRSTFYCPKCQK
ncbi:bifunctional DNA-formamidopyrimidine glycosylase/DNA-(apurinic or apyrimidinic site) lyase [Aestuariivirga litoralis]|uniref:bifunctional DNA-formamidopyrimidine glycosylase/DNA-(apurinic or apyrimidinic site) lyase n=1 Tax=Aestuariivirga litoralis TaxID=2650924 RepID=UPI0018C4D804|nr:bifunctional DNA-formamidopyrimidine glycosylase/DNA-(apurinic or apyrimidinic site) lyase [Aestuariivirga litoralis]MBG1233837.1 bifunctional DNA-formamidopyrimidine glycosylase/DNA-(apurinic or apyrimidinic site) lyase [Aestuariivirga litoralis]